MKQPGRIALWIFSMVMLAVVILQAGRYSFVQDNSGENFGPSGTSAFVQLLRNAGYNVKFDKSFAPDTHDLLVVPVRPHNISEFEQFIDRSNAKTRVLALIIQSESSDSKAPAATLVRSGSETVVGTIEPCSVKPDDWAKPVLKDAETVDILDQQTASTPIVQVTSKNGLSVIVLRDATMATNRHIEKADNANVLMGMVAMLGGPKANVRFVNRFAAGDVDLSLLAKMGAPFQAAWNQLLILVLVIFATLSIRFGLAPEDRARQRGGRELVDGLAWMTRRKKNARWALRAVFERTLAELERRHRVSREQIIQRPDYYLAPEDATNLKYIEAATLEDIDEKDAIKYAKQLKRLV